MSPVRALIVEDIEDAPAGAIEIRRGGSWGMGGMAFVCPCGCGREGYLPFRDPHAVTHPSWIWDGNAEAPTLEPSVLQVGGCQWHGWLRAGEWVSV